MAQPVPQNQPLLDVIAQNKLTVAELNAILQDGAQEVERLIPKLIEQHTTGGKVKAAQLALVQREVRALQSALWGDLGRVTAQGVEQAVVRAAEGATNALQAFYAARGIALPGLREALILQARQGISAVLAKSANGIPLSRAVYRAQALASGQVDRTVARGLLLNNNAKAIAKSVKDLISPTVAGGVSYAAHRLARTEINNAYKTAQEARYEDDPTVIGMQWNLSKSHPKRDECNDYADADDHGLGPGIYPVGQRPRSHPNCLCYLTPESIDEDEFIDKLVAGEYNGWVDEKIYGYAPKGFRPCP